MQKINTILISLFSVLLLTVSYLFVNSGNSVIEPDIVNTKKSGFEKYIEQTNIENSIYLLEVLDAEEQIYQTTEITRVSGISEDLGTILSFSIKGDDGNKYIQPSLELEGTSECADHYDFKISRIGSLRRVDLCREISREFKQQDYYPIANLALTKTIESLSYPVEIYTLSGDLYLRN